MQMQAIEENRKKKLKRLSHWKAGESKIGWLSTSHKFSTKRKPKDLGITHEVSWRMKDLEKKKLIWMFVIWSTWKLENLITSK